MKKLYFFNLSLVFLHFTDNSCKILQKYSKETIGTANLQRGLYVLDSSHPSHACHSSTHDNTSLWHLRLGHISNIGLQHMSKSFPFIPYNCNNKLPCDSCQFSKQKKLSFPNSTSKSMAPFELIHADLWGPFSTIFMLGHKYFLTLVDDFSHYTWVIFLKTKTEVQQHIVHFLAYIKNQFNAALKCFRSDNGTEFLALSSLFMSKGIIHQKSCVYTPQQNGVVERKHQHILNVARALY